LSRRPDVDCSTPWAYRTSAATASCDKIHFLSKSDVIISGLLGHGIGLKGCGIFRVILLVQWHLTNECQASQGWRPMEAVVGQQSACAMRSPLLSAYLVTGQRRAYNRETPVWLVCLCVRCWLATLCDCDAATRDF